MDRAKTLEVLRGMKFMQRKEEAKRREQFEARQKEQIEGRLPQEGAGQGNAGPTIIYVHNVPTSSYALSRRSFKGTVAEASSAASVQAASLTAVVDGSTVHTSVPIEYDMGINGDESEGEHDMDPSAPRYQSHKSAKEGEVDTKGQDAPSKRFYVEGGIRAPKLPKKLTQEMSRRKRQRDEVDGEEEAERPW